MIDLTNRQKNILKDILNGANIDIDNIAKLNNVSPRTIYRDINKITSAISNFELDLIRENNRYFISGKQENLLELKYNLLNMRYELGPDERKKLILAELLISKEPIKLEYFARKFNLTPPAISYYLKDIEEWLKEDNVSILSRPGVGVKIKGSEDNIRRATANFIYENISIDLILDYINGGYEDNTSFIKSKEGKLVELLDLDTITQIEKAIIKLQKQYNYPIMDKVYVNLTIHIALAIKRIKTGEKIILEESRLKKLEKTMEFKLATTLADYIEEYIDIVLPKDEIGYITMHLLGIDYENIKDEEYLELIQEIVNITIKEASKTLHMDFKNDEILINGLTNHYMYAIYRIKSGFKIRNPILNEIKNKYGRLFDRTADILKNVENKINVHIPEDEIGFIAIHLGAAIERFKKNYKIYNIVVVCASGIGTSQMLLSKLKNIPQFNIIKVCSLTELEEATNFYEIDLIISTIPLSNCPIKNVMVTPLLLERDLKKIREALDMKEILDIPLDDNEVSLIGRQNKLRNIAIYGANIMNILENISMITVNSTKDNGIIFELIDIHYKEKRIIETNRDRIFKTLIKRNLVAPIILPNKKFVLYHCATEYVDDILITVGKFKKPIIMKNILGKKERIFTAFLMVAPDEKECVETLGDLSSSIIEDDWFVEELNRSNSIDEVNSIIEKTLLLKYYEEIRRELI